MIETGLYQHYKNKKFYRMLFVAPWWGAPGVVAENALVHIASHFHGAQVSPEPIEHPLMLALWSGNVGVRVVSSEPIVIYVALYDDGRVSARPLKEFEERVDDKAGTLTVVRRVPRFERIGD